MSLSDDIEEGLDTIIAQRDTARRRLGQYQALGVDWLEARAMQDADAEKECLTEFAELLRADLCPVVAISPQQSEVNRLAAVNDQLRQNNEWMDQSRAAAEKRAGELQSANDALRDQVRELQRAAQGKPSEAKPNRLSESARKAASERASARWAAYRAAKAAQNGHAEPAPEPAPTPDVAPLNGKRPLMDREAAASDEMRETERRGEPFTKALLSSIAQRHDLSMNAVERLLGTFPSVGATR